MVKTAILVDGAFFLKRYRKLYKKDNRNHEKVAHDLYTVCYRHLTNKKFTDKKIIE